MSIRTFEPLHSNTIETEQVEHFVSRLIVSGSRTVKDDGIVERAIKYFKIKGIDILLTLDDSIVSIQTRDFALENKISSITWYPNPDDKLIIGNKTYSAATERNNQKAVDFSDGLLIFPKGKLQKTKVFDLFHRAREYKLSTFVYYSNRDVKENAY